MISGKTIVITGAASGIGRAWAEAFLADGAKVVAADINADGLEALEARGAIISITDVGDADAVRAMISLAVQHTGRIDVLFNNAGLGFGYTIDTMPDGLFERHIAIHLFGTVNAMRFAIPHMRRQGHGRIINTISRNAEAAVRGTSAYSAGKAAVWSATRITAREVADTDILVNMLIPGPTNTAIWGEDRPDLQAPDVTVPTARMLATLPAGGPTGKVFWNETEYTMFDPRPQEAR